MRPDLLWLLFADFLQFCSSQIINCTTTMTPGGAHYSVPEFPASHCSYQWRNMTNHVLADKFDKMDNLVVNSSITEILLYNCFEELKYSRSCPYERGTPTALCNMTCPGNGGPENIEGTPLLANTMIIIIIIAVVISGLFAIACIIRCIKKRYLAVNQDNQHADEEDLEQGL